MTNEKERVEQQDQKLEGDIANLFQLSGTDDDELLALVDKHTLQLDGDQLRELLFLRSARNPYLNDLLDSYLEYKHHTNSGQMILDALGAIAFKKFVSLFRININQSK